jgi:hypothetical protein
MVVKEGFADDNSANSATLHNATFFVFVIYNAGSIGHE